MKKNVMTVW